MEQITTGTNGNEERQRLEHEWLQNLYIFYINILALESIQPYTNLIFYVEFVFRIKISQYC